MVCSVQVVATFGRPPSCLLPSHSPLPSVIISGVPHGIKNHCSRRVFGGRRWLFLEEGRAA
jgi:hypothetical protein